MAELEQPNFSKRINSLNDSTQRSKTAIPFGDPRWREERDDFVPKGKVKIGPIAKVAGAGLAALSFLGIGSAISHSDNKTPEPAPIRQAAAPIVRSERIVSTQEYKPPVDHPATKIDPNPIHIMLRDAKGSVKFRSDTTIPELSSAPTVEERQPNTFNLANIVSVNGKPLANAESLDLTGAELVQGPKGVDENLQNPWWVKVVIEVKSSDGTIQKTFAYISRSNNAAPYVTFNKDSVLENFTGKDKTATVVNPIKKP